MSRLASVVTKSHTAVPLTKLRAALSVGVKDKTIRKDRSKSARSASNFDLAKTAKAALGLGLEGADADAKGMAVVRIGSRKMRIESRKGRSAQL